MYDNRFADILDDGNGPDPTEDVLRSIVGRHRRRRVHQYGVVATTAVVAIAGVAVGVGLAHTPKHPTAVRSTVVPPPSANKGAPPAGLTWDRSGSGHAGDQSSAGYLNAANYSSPGGVAAYTAPGEFGFLGPVASFADAGSTASGTSSALFTLNGPATVENAHPCQRLGCYIIFQTSLGATILVRHTQGLTVRASIVSYAFPLRAGEFRSFRALAVPSAAGRAVAGRPGARATGSSPLGAVAIAPSAVARAVPIASTCPVQSELLVTVSSDANGQTEEELVVPMGGSTPHAFAVVASASAHLPGGGTVALAAARTSGAVSSVSATFPGGATDEMAPHEGWVVLVHRSPGDANLTKVGAATLVAHSSAGHVLETAVLPASGSLATAPIVGVCRLLLVPVVASGSGAASAATGTTSGSPGKSP